MVIGEMIAAYRREKKLSLSALADKSGIEKTTLWRLEQGRDASAQHWRAILLFLFSN